MLLPLFRLLKSLVHVYNYINLYHPHPPSFPFLQQRRYNPKYRVADNEQYPLADIEIERILKAWNREFGSGSEMTSAGFVSGISVDGGADDIFA